MKQMRSKRHRALRVRVEASLQILLNDPYRARRAKRLSGEYAGLRSAHIDAYWRLIYRLCEVCREFGDASRRPLACCLTGATPNNTLNVLCVSDHYQSGFPEEFDFS